MDECAGSGSHLLLATKLQLDDFVCEAVLSGRGNIADIAPGPRRQHYLVVQQ